jgi:hypothetical protein
MTLFAGWSNTVVSYVDVVGLTTFLALEANPGTKPHMKTYKPVIGSCKY